MSNLTDTFTSHPYIALTSLIALWCSYVYLDHKPFAPLPLTGTLHIFLFHDKNWYLRWFLDAAKYYDTQGIKTWPYVIGGVGKGLFTVDPAVLKYVLLTKADVFHRDGGRFAEASKDMFGEGILLSAGERWKAQRRAGQVFGTADTLKTIAESGLPRNMHVLLGPLEKAAATGATVDFEEIAKDLTMSVFGELAFDTDAEALLTIARPFDRAIELLSVRRITPGWSITEPLTAKGRQARKDIATVRDFCRGLVRDTMAEIEKEDMGLKAVAHGGKVGMAVKGRFVRELMKTGYEMSEDIIADSCLNFVLAGRDTTSNSMSWTLHDLIRNPSHLARCVAEIDRLPANTPNLDLSTHLPYLDACISESIRLNSPVPVNFAENHSPTDLLLPGSGSGNTPLILKKGEDLIWSPWVFSRLHWIWGPDADDYIPDRWLLGGSAYEPKPTAYEYPIFHAGRRACLGQALSRLELIICLKEVLERYNFKCGKGWDGSYRKIAEGLTAPMIGGLPIKVERRS